MCAATDEQALQAMRFARDLFARTLASWASDQLMLQRRGLDQPTWHGGSRLRRAA
jgi:hypothetical protein